MPAPRADTARTHPRPLRPEGLILRVAPFAGTAIAGLVLCAFPARDGRPLLLVLAALLTAALLAAAFGVPWGRLPAWTQAIPALAYDGVVALMMASVGPQQSRLVLPLVLLPVVWLALHGSRLELGLAIAAALCVTAGHAIWLGTEDAWIGPVLWTAVAAAVGMTVQALVRRSREAAADLGRVLAAARELASSGDPWEVRGQICRAAADLCGATAATLLEPDGERGLVVRAAVPASLEGAHLHLEEPSGAVAAYRTGRSSFVPDLRAHPGVSQRMVRETGTVSALFEPIIRDGRSAGVLAVAWPTGTARLPDRSAAVISLLAAEAAVAIGRAELLASLDARARELEALGRLKGEFVANVSHELRSPLATIIGYAQIMLDDVHGPLTASQRHDLAQISGAGTRLLVMVNDLLDLAGLESGRVGPAARRCDARDLAGRATAEMAPAAAARGLALRLRDEAGDGAAEVFCDPERVRQVLVELIDNAVKFTEDGEVSVAVRALDGHCLIEVADTGPGIPADQLPLIWEPLRQLDGSDTRRAGGAGLGLALARGLVAMQGGTLWCRSEPGRGSTFTISLPAAADQVAAEREPPVSGTRR
jgi:signal transduction histidine kinase